MSNANSTGNRFSRLSRVATAAGLASVLAFSLSACSPASNASPEASTSAASASAAPTETKPAYTKVTLDPNSPAYTPNADKLPKVTAFGWTADKVADGQRFAVDYVVNEFLDSSALEGGDEAYRAWHTNEAKKYFTDSRYETIADGTGTVVVGNIKGRFMLPELINDGSPRLKNLNLVVSDLHDNSQRGLTSKGITYVIEYSGKYRVSDASAVKFMSEYSVKALPAEKHLTPEQFLSNHATPMLKDGTGENNMRIGGSIIVVLTENAEGKFVIDAFRNESELNTEGFEMDPTYFEK